jgi:alkylhydroperoxidase family enzyme
MPRIEIPEGAEEEYTRLWQLAPDIAKPAGRFSASVYKYSKLSMRLRELVRTRIALINECHL